MRKKVRIYDQGVGGQSFACGVIIKDAANDKMERGILSLRLTDGRIVTTTVAPGRIMEVAGALDAHGVAEDKKVLWDVIVTTLLDFGALCLAWVPLPPCPAWLIPAEMVVRMVLCIAVRGVLRLVPAWRRMLMYHGAEHKAIRCYHKGLALTVTNAKKQSRISAGCNTKELPALLLWLSLAAQFLPGWLPMAAAVLSAAAVGKHVTRWAFAVSIMWPKCFGWLGRGLMDLGKRLQLITTMEPTDDMLEVALKAVSMVAPAAAAQRGNRKTRRRQ